MYATGAPVTGLGQVGAFFRARSCPGTNNCTYGDVAIGPSGQVMQVCSLTESGQGGGKLFVNVDPDGLGPAGFGGPRLRHRRPTSAGSTSSRRSRTARWMPRPGLAWDRTGGPHNGRVYLVYTLEQRNESDNTDIYVRYSDDNGATWSAGVRVNDDSTANSQFLPKISLDPTTGNIAVVWYDARNDRGTGGPGDTDGIPNDDAQFWGAFSTDGRRHLHPQHPDQRRHLELPRLRQRHRLRRLHGPVVLRRHRPSGLVRQLQQHRQQPGRRAAPTGHLHRRDHRAIEAPGA